MMLHDTSARGPPGNEAEHCPNSYLKTHSQEKKEMKLFYLYNDGGGYADYVQVSEGITVEEFFAQREPGRRAEDYLIRVNRQPVTRDQVLQEGDRVSVTPLKIQGAKVT